ncbi:MAG: tetraacyldisaccharide 4'-kinase [Bacteroidales bacterium]|nr:tetraacyldisaccharide 4'-kinase [Bacteroidales bacterium]
MAGFRHISRPLLLPFSVLYGMVVAVRNLLFDKGILPSTRFKLPVISIGNITVGGTGKTPHVEYLIRLLKEDYKIAVLSRGYKRKTKDFMLASVRSDVADVGDEPLQLKLKFPDIPVAVEKNRVKGVKILTDKIHKLNAVILDDAFQHRYIRPGLSILLVDYTRPVFNDILLPAGNLREPRRNSKRADIIIVTKCPGHLSPHEKALFISRLQPTAEQEVYFTRYVYGNPVAVFADKHGQAESFPLKHFYKPGNAVMLVTGIANPEPLKLFLEESVPVHEEMAFPDHHNYDKDDFQRIKKSFKTIEAVNKFILTTEKDAVRIRNSGLADKNLRKVFFYLPVEVKFLAKGEKPFIKQLYKYIKKSGY